MKKLSESFGYASGFSALNSTGDLLLLIALLHLSPSVQFPIVTGVTIVFSLLTDIVEKVTIREVASAVIAFGASDLMAL